MVDETEEAQNFSHICLELMPLPGFDGERIPFLDLIDLIPQKDVAASFENHDEMTMPVMFERRKPIFFHLEITELHGKILIIIEKDLLRHIPEDPGILFINVGLDTVPPVFVCMKMMNHNCPP